MRQSCPWVTPTVAAGAASKGPSGAKCSPQKLPDETRLLQRQPGQPPGAGPRRWSPGFQSPACGSPVPPPSVSVIMGHLVFTLCFQSGYFMIGLISFQGYLDPEGFRLKSVLMALPLDARPQRDSQALSPTQGPGPQAPAALWASEPFMSRRSPEGAPLLPTWLGFRGRGRFARRRLPADSNGLSSSFWVQFLIRLIHKELSCPGSATGDQVL